MEKTRRTTDLAILGVLAQGGPMSGYDIKAYIDLSISQFWGESFGQIYPALKGLEADGLVTRRADRASPRDRAVYEVTKRGRRLLAAWLAEPPAPERPRNETILKTFLGDQAPPGAIRGHLEAYAERAEARVARLREQEREVRRTDAGTRALPFAIATIRAGIHLARARAAWAREAIALIENLSQGETSDDRHA
jgi:DNA-binding PadR family transcriptional regulator